MRWWDGNQWTVSTWAGSAQPGAVGAVMSPDPAQGPQAAAASGFSRWLTDVSKMRKRAAWLIVSGPLALIAGIALAQAPIDPSFRSESEP